MGKFILKKLLKKKRLEVLLEMAFWLVFLFILMGWVVRVVNIIEVRYVIKSISIGIIN